MSATDFSSAALERRQLTASLKEKYAQLHVSAETPHIIRIHTTIRDVTTPRDEFIFGIDLLIRSLIENALESCEYEAEQVLTPSGYVYHGLKLKKEVTACSIMRAGEVLETALKDSVFGIKIGKILVESDHNNADNAKLFYAKLPSSAPNSTVFLCDSVLDTGITSRMCINALINAGVKVQDIVFLNLIATPSGIDAIMQEFPDIKIYTTMVDTDINMGNVANLYYGTNQNASK